MGKTNRIKRRLVRQVVDENLAVMRGQPAVQRGRRLRFVLFSARVFFFLAVPAALFASTYVLSMAAEGWLEVARPAQVGRLAADSSGLAPLAAPAAESEEPTSGGLTIPEPIGRAVLPLEVRRVIVDPGHGGRNQGTVAPLGLVEKDLTLDIAQRLTALLEQSSYEVVMTRSADEGMSLKERAELANRLKGDIFISIHVNWFEIQGARGIETYILGPTDDPYISELAARENQDSGYSLADFRTMLERVYADVRHDESRQLARAVQSSLYRSLRKVSPAIENRGVKTAPFGVLIHTEMPAILAEVSCLSNDQEARNLNKPSYRQYIAEALFDGIARYSTGLNPASSTGS